MKKIIFAILILVCWTASLSAEIYHSSFGFTINIPSHWLIVSKQEVKDNPDLFNVEIYYNQNTTDAYFRDKILVGILAGRLPQTVSERKITCTGLPGELSRAYGKHIKVYKCGFKKVSGLNAFYAEFDGVVDGTRSIQYQIQKSPSVVIIITATCKNTSLSIIKKEFENMVSSIKIK
jgi:hypothetical protein